MTRAFVQQPLSQAFVPQGLVTPAKPSRASRSRSHVSAQSRNRERTPPPQSRRNPSSPSRPQHRPRRPRSGPGVRPHRRAKTMSLGKFLLSPADLSSSSFFSFSFSGLTIVKTGLVIVIPWGTYCESLFSLELISAVTLSRSGAWGGGSRYLRGVFDFGWFIRGVVYSVPTPQRANQSVRRRIVSRISGTYARIAPRSGLAVKKGINVGAGVVDFDYRGEVFVSSREISLVSQVPRWRHHTEVFAMCVGNATYYVGDCVVGAP